MGRSDGGSGCYRHRLPRVLAQQATQLLGAGNRPCCPHWIGARDRGLQPKSPVGTGRVVVLEPLGEDPLEMAAVEDLGDRSTTPPIVWADQMGVQAATGTGSRAYSRNKPPSCSVQVTAPAARTGSERAIGVCNPRARWGRAEL